MNTRPPTHLVMEMTPKDVKENLSSIVESMERIRRETITNLEASDEQKINYLRLTSELAGCLNAVAEENGLNAHLQAVDGLVRDDILLRNYDPLQAEFWNDRQPQLMTALEDACVVLMRDDFTSEDQAYHIFQGIKYLTIKSEPEKDDVYETIQPVNGLISSQALSSPEVCRHLFQKVLAGGKEKKGLSGLGMGIRATLDEESLVRGLEQIGALYVDLPASEYQALKRKFPLTRLVEDGKDKYARVVFGQKESSTLYNAFNELLELASVDFGQEAEGDLVRRAGNFFGFGKVFLQALTDKVGINSPLPPKKRAKGYSALTLDDSPADDGKKRTRNDWLAYWNNVTNGRVMASMPDLYLAFKDLKQAYESGSEEEKARAEELLKSLREDFQWPGKNNWLISSTRITYQANSLDTKIIHHYQCPLPEMVKEINLEVPEYLGRPLLEVLGEEKGLKYLKSLFDTEDETEILVQTLEFISGKNRGNIKVWTPPLNECTSYATRKEYLERAAGLYYNLGVFHVDGLSIIYDRGRSRGVSFVPR